jgi:hypothetical protein
MSLFGAKKSTFQKAKERLDKKMAEDSLSGSEAPTSGIREVLDRHNAIIGRLDPDGTATTSDIAQEPADDGLGGPVVLPREVYNEAARMHNQEARERG